jgi:ATP-dependent Lon protease
VSEMSEVSQEEPFATNTLVDAASAQSELDRKINRLFPGAVVRKDLVRAVKGNAIVPSYLCTMR